MNLSDLLEARKLLSEHYSEEGYLSATIKEIKPEHITALTPIEEAIYEVRLIKDNFITIAQLDQNIGKSIELKIDIGYFETYYSTISEFIQKNKYELKHYEYFIEEAEISSSDDPLNTIIENYFKNLDLIELLKSLANHDSLIAGELKLYFHKIGESLILPIDYSVEDLSKSKVVQVNDLKGEFDQDIHKVERKRLFINDLINLYTNKKKNYSLLLNNLNLLKENYYISYDVFLEGFSFEKIKTSSLEHFHDLNDKIHETVRKVSNYIFGIPIAFLFLISRLDFSNNISTLKNISLLGVGYIFIILIWKVFFKSVKESLDSIKADIDRYEDKIKHITRLSSITASLEKLKTDTLEEQYKKLKLLKLVVFIIAVGISALVLYIGWKDINEKTSEVILFVRSLFQDNTPQS